MLTLLLIGMLTLAFNIHPVKSSGTIYIRADGRVDPPTANITSADNVTYTFTDNNYDSVVIKRDNIVVDGAGYTVQGTGGGTGIDLTGRTNVTVLNTQVKNFNYGIHLGSSSNNSISGNNIANSNYGIYLYHSSNYNSISGNTFVGDGLFVSGSYGNVVEDNTVNGKPLVYLEDVSHQSVAEAGQVILVNCEYIQVQNLNLSHTTVGLQLWKTNNTLFSGNNIANNYYDGIWVDSSSNNSISGNNITANNEIGIRLYSSSNYNSISGNTIANNLGHGIHLGSSSNNSIYHNTFINNTDQVYSSGSVNVWDDGYPSGGNYWSDYTGADLHWSPYQNMTGSDGIGDTPYIIDENNQDNYPLMSPYEYWSNPIVGDINKDMTVDYEDLFQLAAAYGSTPEKPNWNPNCDFNIDNKVDASDLFDLGKNCGKTV